MRRDPTAARVAQAQAVREILGEVLPRGSPRRVHRAAPRWDAIVGLVLAIGSSVVLDRAGLGALLAALIDAGHELIGPAVRDGAIVLGPLTGIDDLPRGVGDEQAPGHYRLQQRGDDALFGYAAPPQSWKRELLVP
ncbi:MAG TPA: hypothetical protein VF488_14355, partial [Gemmatimonadaceae bacterium]